MVLNAKNVIVLEKMLNTKINVDFDSTVKSQYHVYKLLLHTLTNKNLK